MKKKTKNLILSIVVTLILLLTFTVTYAVFTYGQTGENNQQLVLGDIWMSYEESNGIDLSGAMPGDDYSEYFEFTISGKNTYTKQDIYYDVVLSKGDVPTDKKEDNRISDEYLKFKLVEVNDDNSETIIFTDKTYSDLTNKRIWVETIPKNTTDEYTKTYRLYMVINDNLIIGNTEDAVMTTEDYKKAFTSIKVNVTGDFKEKELAYEDMYNVTDASCFEVEETTVSIHNSNMTDEEINTCVTYFSTNEKYGEYFIENLTNNGETIEKFCDGTGTAMGMTFQELLSYGEGGFTTEDLIYFKENNIIIITDGLAITDYDATCGSDVVIPETINGNNVVAIGESTFLRNQLTSVVIPDSVIIIGVLAFAENLLTDVVIPDGIRSINFGAFSVNLLTSVVIPDSVVTIGYAAFSDNYIEKVTLGKSVKMIDQVAFALIPEYGSIGNKITHVINKSGNTFNWQSIFAVDSTDGNDEFATGTFKYYDNYYGEKVVLITSE